MANEKPLNDLDEQPSAADESCQGLDDPALAEPGVKAPESRFLALGSSPGVLQRRFLSPSGIPDPPFLVQKPFLSGKFILRTMS